jgi:protein TonB
MSPREPSTEAGARWTGAALAFGLHALALAVLMSYAPARSALLAAAPIMVSLVSPSQPEPKPALEVPPRPKPVIRPQPRPPEPPPLVAAPAESPALVSAPPSPVTSPPPEPVAAPLAAPVAIPVAVTAPIFNADYLDNPAPEYPRLSRRNGEQGRVVLRVLVNAAGRADDIEVRASSGYSRLDQAARDTVRRWRFVPAKRGGDPVPAWVLIPISFKLEG